MANRLASLDPVLPSEEGPSNLVLLGDLKRIVNFDAEVANGALQLGVIEHELYCSQVLRPSVDEGGLGSPDRMSPVRCGVPG